MSETSSNKDKGDWSKREIGALWLRKSAAGNKYLSGHVATAEDEGLEEGSREKIIVFANKDKKNEKAPDYRIYKSESQPQKTSPETQQPKEESEEELDVL